MTERESQGPEPGEVMTERESQELEPGGVMAERESQELEPGGATSGKPTSRKRASRERTFPVLDGQRGLATAAQLYEHGWTPSSVRHARERTIQQVLPGVYAPHRGPLGGDDRLVAAKLWAGDGAVLTGRVALERHGLDVDSGGTCVFLVPESHRARQAGGVRTVRTGRRIRVAAHRDCVPVTDVARALCDAVALQDLAGEALEATTISALQRRLTHPSLLSAELAQRSVSSAADIRSALDAFTSGAWSLPEASLAQLVAQAPDLVGFVQNVELSTTSGTVIGTPDGYFTHSGVVVQVHSRQFHSGIDDEGRDRWSTTVEKDGRYVENGVAVVQVTPASIHRRPERVIARLRSAVEANRGRDLAHLVVRDRHESHRLAAPDR